LFEIDGSKKSGSGTILRLSLAISAITEKPLHIFNIRNNRAKPGLKPQHLEAVITAGKLCNAKIRGAEINSSELWFTPKKNKGGVIFSSIGTAGSISALIMTVLPICIFSKNPVRLCINKGGTDVLHSPTINFMRFVFLNTLRKMGIQASIQVNSYGYYPKGMGKVILEVKPSISLHPINLERFGKITYVGGLSISTFLKKQKVSERQANAATTYLNKKGYAADIKVVYDESNPFQKGSSITLWAETTTGILIGSDAIGAPRKSSEEVGREAAKKMNKNLQSKATVDVNLSDMLIPFMALTKGKSSFSTRLISDHLETNIWLMEKLLNTRFIITKTDNLYRVTKND
jgi:RNA 3'-phosphate cyclase